MVTGRIGNALAHPPLIYQQKKFQEEPTSMLIRRRSYAGTLESSDLLVEIQPPEDDKLTVHVTSSVEKQFKLLIHEVVLTSLRELNVQSATIIINDKGALDCVIKARIQAAVLRATEENGQEHYWSDLS